MRLARGVGEVPDPGSPLGELLLRVVVAEPFSRADILLLPLRRISPVEAHHGQVLGRGRSDWREARVESLRHVHAHERKVVVLEERERLVAVALLEPGLVSKLHGDAEVLQPLRTLGHVVLVLA